MKRSIIFGSLVAALLLSAAAYATADTLLIAGVAGSATGPVAVKATVSPKLTLTIDTPGATSQTVDFGIVDPGSSISGGTVNLSVDSNKAFTLGKTVSGSFAEIGLTTSALAAGGAKGEDTLFADAYTINVPWGTAPLAYTATVQYTVTQQ